MSTENNDIRTTGVSGLRGLKSLIEAERTVQPEQGASFAQLSEMYRRDKVLYNSYAIQPHTTYLNAEQVPEDFGTSKYDMDIKTLDDLFNLDDFRSGSQNELTKLGAGLIKMVTTGLSTTVNSTLGLVAGLVNGVNQSSIQPDNKNLNWFQEFGGGMINNPVNESVVAFQEMMEQIAPNYQSKQETETPWWERAITRGMWGNFWGNDVLKNVGFSLGSVAAMGVWNKAVLTPLVSKLNKASGTIAQSLKNPTLANKIASKILSGEQAANPIQYLDDLGAMAKGSYRWNQATDLFGAFLGATGEAQIEALHSANEFRDTHIANLEKYLQQGQRDRLSAFAREHPEHIINGELTPKGQEVFAGSEQALKEQALTKIEDSAIKVGNNVFAFQTALLTASNIMVWGKSMAGGYSAARKSLTAPQKFVKTLEDGTFGVKKGMKNFIGGLRIAKGGFVEGFEEMGQFYVSKVAQAHIGGKTNNYLIDTFMATDENEKSVVNLMNTMLGSAGETVSDSQAWLEFAVGAFMGMAGLPMIKHNAKGKLRPTWTGGLASEIRSMANEDRLRVDAINQVNAIINDPEKQELYKSVLRSIKYNKDMQKYAFEGDALGYKDAEFKSIISDAMAYRNLGKLDTFLDNLKRYSEINDEQAKELAEKLLINETGESSVYTPQAVDQVRETIQKQSKQFISNVEKFVELSDNLKVLYGNKLSSNYLDQVAFNIALAENKKDRAMQMHKEVFSILNKVTKTTVQDVNSPNIDTIIKDLLSVVGVENLAKAEKLSQEDQVLYEDFMKITGVAPNQLDDFGTKLIEKLVKYDLGLVQSKEIPQKVMDIIANIVHYKAHVANFVRGLGDPEGFMKAQKDLTAAHIEKSIKENTKALQNLTDEKKYNEELDKLSTEIRSGILAEHAKSTMNVGDFAKARIGAERIQSVTAGVLKDTKKKYPEQIKETFKGLVAAQKGQSVSNIINNVKVEVSKLKNPQLSELTTDWVNTLVADEAINSTYTAQSSGTAGGFSAAQNTNKSTDASSSNTTVIELTPEQEAEIATLRKEASEVGGRVMANRIKTNLADVNYQNALLTILDKWKVIDGMKFRALPVTYLDNKQNVMDMLPELHVVYDVSTNQTKIYFIPSEQTSTIKTQTGFVNFYKTAKPVGKIVGPGVTLDHLFVIFKNLGLDPAVLDEFKTKGTGNVYQMWAKTPASDIFATAAWAQPVLEGEGVADEKLYDEIIQKIFAVPKGKEKAAEIQNTSSVIQIAPAEGLKEKNLVYAYKKEIGSVPGEVVYNIMVINALTSAKKAYKLPWMPLHNITAYVDDRTLESLKTNDKIDITNIKLHKLFERIGSNGAKIYSAEILDSENNIVIIELNGNYIQDRIDTTPDKLNQFYENSFSTVWANRNFEITEYHIGKEHDKKATPVKYVPGRDQFTHDVFVSSKAYEFVNSGKLRDMHVADPNLKIHYTPLTEYPGVLTSITGEDPVIFMYVITKNGDKQIVGQVPFNNDALIAKITASKLDSNGYEYTSEIKHFKAGEVAIDNDSKRTVKSILTPGAPLKLALVGETTKNGLVIKVTPGVNKNLIQWGVKGAEDFKGHPILLIPAADGSLIPHRLNGRGLSEDTFVTLTDNKVLFNTKNTIVARVVEAINNISTASDLNVMKAAADEINQLLYFKDPNNNKYRLNVQYSQQEGRYFIAIESTEKNSNVKRRFFASEFDDYTKYKHSASVQSFAAAEDDGFDTLADKSKFSFSKGTWTDKRATLVLGEDVEQNSQNITAMLFALNPLFNLSTEAFDEHPVGNTDLTISDWLDHELINTTLKMDRTYNGLFFVKEAGEDHVVKNFYEEANNQVLNIGYDTASVGKGYDVSYEFNGNTLTLTRILEANKLTKDTIVDVTNSATEFELQISNYTVTKAFVKVLEEWMQRVDSFAQFGTASKDGFETIYHIKIGGRDLFYHVTKRYSEKGELTYSAANTKAISKEVYEDYYKSFTSKPVTTPSLKEVNVVEQELLDAIPAEPVVDNTTDTKESTTKPKRKYTRKVKEKTFVAEFLYDEAKGLTPSAKVFSFTNKAETTLEELVKDIENNTVNIVTYINSLRNVSKRMVPSFSMSTVDLLQALQKYQIALKESKDVDPETYCKKK